ncbi:MAG: hypothetical protein EXR98_05325 [Gemmataceae bacterium]|nr:hypothetical protein [Gemmataceae bacterium]
MFGSVMLDVAAEHVSGWYKHEVHAINLTLGISLAVFINVDTFLQTQFLRYNPAVREKIVEAANAAAKN